MRPTTVTPDDLFRPQRRYVIPLFQRGYVWTEQDHWGPLWRDIVLQARRVGLPATSFGRGHIRRTTNPT